MIKAHACMRVRHEPCRASAATFHAPASCYLGLLLCLHAVRYIPVSGGAEAVAHATPVAAAAATSSSTGNAEREGLIEESIGQGPDVCSRSVAAEESQHARDITKGRTEMDSRQVGTLIRMADVRAPVVRAADARSSGSTAARGTGWPNSTCGCLRFFMLGELFTGAKSLLHWVNTDPAVHTPPSLERFDLSWTQDRVEGNLFARVRALRLLVTLVLLPRPRHALGLLP